MPGLSSVEEAEVIALGAGIETSAIPALRMHVVEVARATSDESIAAYRADARVESVDRDRLREAEATPDDPAYPDQWALPKIGWDQAYGVIDPPGSATIAILDTGVDAVGDLSLVGGYSAFGNGTADGNGHGTWVASIAAATVNNGTGIAGVGYDGVSVMPVKVLAADGTGQDSDIIAGVVWAADHGADVILMAFSNPGYSQALQDAIDYAWSRGAVPVAAVGNDGSTTPTYPAGDAKVVGVAATSSDDTLWAGSNFSAAAFISAPGVGISADGLSGTTSVTGTSASAAIVAGAAAVLKANDASAGPGVIVGRLARNTDAGGAGNGRLNLARSLYDMMTDEVVPAGAPGGGPVVGPYVAAACTLISVSIGAQAPSTVIPGGAASYTVTTNHSGGNCTVNVSVSGLPAGATASFVPASNTSNSAVRTFTLTIQTTGATPVGANSFTVIASGPDANGSPKTTNGSLSVVAPDANAPNGNFSVTPDTVSPSSTNGFSLSFVQTTGTAHGGASATQNAQCIELSLVGFTVNGPSALVAAPVGHSWAASTAGTTVTLQADTSSDQLHFGETITLDVTATAGAAGDRIWTARAYSTKSGTACSGASNTQADVVRVATPPAPGAGGGAANLDQCQNGTFTSFQICQNPNWVNGNLNPNNSHYREGDSVPFRMRMDGFNNTGPHTLVIEYDTTKSGAHAYDYLTSFDRTESSANPCSGVAGCTLASATFFPIPTDPSLAAASPAVIPVAQAQRQMAIWNGTITGISYTGGPAAGENGGSPEGTNLTTEVTITFTAATAGSTVVIAWGGHVASYIDWGEGDSASGISGSPYHMRLVSLNGGGGNQDRSIAGSAIPEAPLPITTQASQSQVDLPGGSVTDTVTFTPNTGSPNPSGTARFFVCGPSTTAPNCTSGGTQVGSDVVFTDQTSVTSAPYAPTDPGLYCFRVEYIPAASSPYSPGLHTNQVIGTNGECFSAKPKPGISTDVAPDVVTLGSSFTDTATLSEVGTRGDVKGSVEFFLCGPSITAPDCSTGGTSIGSSAVTLNTDNSVNTDDESASKTHTPGSTGVYCVRAVYTPDPTYTAAEGYASVSHTNQSLTSPNNECFTVVNLGSIRATKYNDRDGDHTRAASGEEGLAGWRLFIDTNGNQTYEGGTDISPALTDSNGEVVFAGLTPGTYAVCEVLQSGWANTDPTDASRCKNVTVVAGSETPVALGNQTRGSISGQKFNDRDGNGTDAGAGEEGLGGWTINLGKCGADCSTTTPAGSTTTSSAVGFEGLYSFTDLAPGTYKVCEVAQAGWTQTSTPTCHEVTLSAATPSTSTGQDFGNQTRGSISGQKFNDVDGDGVFDAGEPNLEDWTIRLCLADGCAGAGDPTQTDVSDGSGYSFTGLAPGTYYVCEVLKAGWQQNSPSGCHTVVISADSPTNETAKDFGNASADVDLVKTGPASVTAGGGVSWTVVVTNNGPSNAIGTSLTDTVATGPGFTGVDDLEYCIGTGAACDEDGEFSNYTGPISLGTLIPTQQVTVQLRADVPAGAESSDDLKNCASVSSNVEDPDAIDESCTTADVAEDVSLTVEKEFGGGPFPAPDPDDGDTADAGTSGHIFRIKVTNTGTSEADAVSITDAVDPDLTLVSVAPLADCDNAAATLAAGQVDCSFAHLGAGQSVTVTVTFDIDETVEAQLITNTATADADDTDPSSDSDTLDVAEDVSLTVEKEFGADFTSNADEVIAGSTGNFMKIKVTNTGASEADAVSITDDLPSGLHATAVSSTAGTCTLVDSAADGDVAADDVSCTLVHLGSGASVTITVTYSADPDLEEGGVKTNTAAADADDTNEVTDSDTVTVRTRADLVVDKTGDATVFAGDTIHWTVTVTNNGPSYARNVTLSDTFPAGTTNGRYCIGTGTSCDQESEFTPYTGPISLGDMADLAIITVTLRADVPFPFGTGPLENSATATSDTTDPNPTNNTDTHTTNVIPRTLPGTSTMTNSAFQLVDDLSPWTITDFEILMNPKYEIVATNPGQFYYHQRVENSFAIATDVSFNIDWPNEFAPQTTTGMPIHVYVQYAGDAPNVWHDITPNAAGNPCWTSAPAGSTVVPPSCLGSDGINHDGAVSVTNIPAGAEVWVTVHLDYRLKGTTKSADFVKKPIPYGPFESKAELRAAGTPFLIGTSYSSTSLLGRGKKVTVVYGTIVDAAGNPLGGVQMKVQQNSGPIAYLTSDPTGGFVVFDGQLCTGLDGLTGCSSGTVWNFAAGSNVNTTITILGDGVSASYPAGFTKFSVYQGNQTFVNNSTANPIYSFGVTKGSAYKRNWRFSN